MARMQHMVLLRFKPQVSEDQIADFFALLANLQEVIPGIEHFGCGPYASPEGMNHGYTHGFLMTFRDKTDRDRYLDDPQHERVKQQILPWVESVVVFDFED